MSLIRAQDTFMPVKMNSIALLSVEICQFYNCSHLFLFAEVTCAHHVCQQHNHNTNEHRSAAERRSWYSWRDFLLHLICDDRVWKLARDWRISCQQTTAYEDQSFVDFLSNRWLVDWNDIFTTLDLRKVGSRLSNVAVYFLFDVWYCLRCVFDSESHGHKFGKMLRIAVSHKAP